MHAVVSKIAVCQYASMSARPYWQLPTMHFLPVVVNHFDNTWTGEVCEHHIARRRLVMNHTSKADAAAKHSALFHGGSFEPRVANCDGSRYLAK